MTRTTKRLVCLAAALIFVLTLVLPCVALAEPQKDFTGYTPISTKEGLDAIRNDPYGRYYLTQDIVFTQEDFAPGGAFYNDGAGWIPIDTLRGTLDGNGYTIRGLRINYSKPEGAQISRAGLFGEINGKVKNLTLADCQIVVIRSGEPAEAACVGTIAGEISMGSEIVNCVAKGSIVGKEDTYIIAGGLVGCYYASQYEKEMSSRIVGCTSAVDITHEAFETDGNIVKSEYVGRIGGIIGVAGGLNREGTIDLLISRCSNSGALCGGMVGGIIGPSSNNVQINDCYNAGEITVPEKSNFSYGYRCGGIAVFEGCLGAEIRNCYNRGTLRGNNAYGIAHGSGRNPSASVEVADCYCLDVALPEGIISDPNGINGTICTGQQMNEQATYAGFDFDTIWQMGETGYPVLRAYDESEEETWTLISTKEELNAVRNDLNGNYRLTQDIVFTQEDFAPGGAFYNDGAGWEPIGGNPPGGAGINPGFAGIFDGNGYEIQGLRIFSENTVNVGLFANIGGSGIVLNLGITDAVVEVKNTVLAANAGILVGYSEGYIQNCYTTGSVTVSGRACSVGGISGFAYRVSDSFNMVTITNMATITADYNTGWSSAGGICGIICDGYVERCYNAGSVVARDSQQSQQRLGSVAGGIVGNAVRREMPASIPGCYVRDCYNTGTVTVQSKYLPGYAAGICGWMSNGNIQTCYNVGQVSAGDGASNAGQIAGLMANGMVTDCYYLKSQTAQQEAGAMACTGLQLTQQATFAGFDFDAVWTMQGGENYPYPELIGLPMAGTGQWDTGDGQTQEGDGQSDGAIETDVPQTGDATGIAAWIALAAGCLTGGVGIVWYKKKHAA